MRRPWVAFIAAAALTGALVGCDDQGRDDPSVSEALYPVGDRHKLCTPAGSGAHTEGLATFGNRGPLPVSIEEVEWPTSGDVEVDSIRVFQRSPGDQFSSVGLWAGLPQDALTGTFRRAWDRAQEAEGASVPEANPDGSYLVFVVGFRGTLGTGGPLTLHFTDAEGNTGEATSFVDLRVAKRCGNR